MRQLLVVLQFALLIGLLIATVSHRQARFALTEAKRLDSDQVILVSNAPCRGAFKDAVGDISGVRAVDLQLRLPLGDGSSFGSSKSCGWQLHLPGRALGGIRFLRVLGSGPQPVDYSLRSIRRDALPTDPEAKTRGAVVLNEAAVRRLGFTSAKDAVGQSLTWSSPQTSRLARCDRRRPPKSSALCRISPSTPCTRLVRPIVYYVDPDFQGIISVRIDGRRTPETLGAIDKLWKRVGSPGPIRRSFLDQRITALYADITRQELLLAVFSSVAISIAILGLFGMSASMSELRTKEIGVRKAMGASRADVVRLLLWQFTRPVVLANLIAWPLGYVLMQRWLNGFAQHIPLAPWLFLAPSGIAAAIAR